MKEMILALTSYLHNFALPVKDEKGQGMVEYALIIVLVAIAVITALTALGGQVTTVFNTITSDLGV